MKTATILGFVLLSLLGSSCQTEMELPLHATPKIVLLGEFVAGDTIHFRGGQSIPLQSGKSAQPEILRDLAVSVKETDNHIGTLHGVEDDISTLDYTLSYSTPALVQEGGSYRVEAASQSIGTATAQITIPVAFAAAVTDTERTVYHDENVLRIKVQLQDDAPATQYYVIEVLQDNARMGPPSRLTFYTDDAASENVLDSKGDILSGRVLLQDKYFSGSLHSTTIYIPLYQIMEQFPGMENHTLVQVKSVTADYFRFLQAYVNYDPFPALEDRPVPSVLKGNIENGLGMLGGVFRREFSFIF